MQVVPDPESPGKLIVLFNGQERPCYNDVCSCDSKLLCATKIETCKIKIIEKENNGTNKQDDYGFRRIVQGQEYVLLIVRGRQQVMANVCVIPIMGCLDQIVTNGASKLWAFY